MVHLDCVNFIFRDRLIGTNLENNDFIIFHSYSVTTNQNISTHTKNNFNNNIDSFWRPPQFPSLSAHPQDTTTFFICHGSRKIIYGEG
jgi:hypothetical protein